MALKFFPPFLKKLSSDNSPLVDNDEIQDEIVRMKVDFERQDRQARGDLFAGPVAQSKAEPERSLPFPELMAPAERGNPLASPVAPRTESPPPPDRPLPGGLALGGPIAPPSAPPPPPPADRPPGMFRFDPEEVDAE